MIERAPDDASLDMSFSLFDAGFGRRSARNVGNFIYASFVGLLNQRLATHDVRLLRRPLTT